MNVSIERYVWIAFGTKKEKEEGWLSPHLYRESIAITPGFDLEIGQGTRWASIFHFTGAFPRDGTLKLYSEGKRRGEMQFSETVT